MSATKTTVIWGLTAKLEASYNAGATMSTATDGVMLAKEAIAEKKFVKDGERAPAAGSGGENIGATPSGSYMEVPLECEGHGPGSAYSASVFAEIHPLLRASGLGAVLDATGGSEKYTYAPTTPQLTAQASIAASAYSRGELTPLQAGYCEWEWSIEPGGFWMHMFNLFALCGDPTDVPLPSITYQSVVPPKAESVVLSITPAGGSAITATHWRKMTFKLGRERSPRLDGNTTAHMGWTPGRRKPRFTVTLEQEALSVINPYNLLKNATKCAISFGFGTGGTGVYNRQEFAMAQAQVVQVTPQADGASGLVELTFAPRVSTPNAVDDFTYVTK